MEVGDRGSFSGAADALLLTQSGVSQHVAALERACGAVLVERGTRPLVLTEVGLALSRHARALMARLDSAEHELLELTASRHGRLRLGSFPTALATFVPEVLARFQQRHPQVALTVVDDHLQRLLPRLEDFELDLAIGYDHPSAPVPAGNRWERFHLFDDPYQVILSPRHRLAASTRAIALEGLRAETWIGADPLKQRMVPYREGRLLARGV